MFPVLPRGNFMTREEIEKEAMRGNAMPQRLALYQQQYYLCMRLLYKRYRSGAINRDQARKEKAELNCAYDVGELYDQCGKRNRERERMLNQLIVQINKGDGCKLCEKIVRVLDGRP